MRPNPLDFDHQNDRQAHLQVSVNQRHKRHIPMDDNDLGF